MLVPNRHQDSKEYRYGFNGKEKDDEIKGEGTQYDYGFRIYDPRIGKFLSQDPLFKTYAWYTPYQFAGNKPISSIDLDGLEEFMKINYYNIQGKLYKTELTFSTEYENLEGTKIHLQNIFQNESRDGGIFTSVENSTADLPVLNFLSKEFGYPNKNGNPNFVVRGNGVAAFNSKTNLFNEFRYETGPENSVMFGDKQVMVSDAKKLVGVKNITIEAYRKWAKDGQIKAGESYTGGNAPFGAKGGARIFFNTENTNSSIYERFWSTEHFLGSYAVNLFVLDDGKTILYCISDSKTFESATAHTVNQRFGDHPRGSYEGGFGSTNQRYIWTESIDSKLFNDILEQMKTKVKDTKSDYDIQDGDLF